jgi:hypothetical protein
MRRFLLSSAVCVLFGATSITSAEARKPAAGPLATRWAKEVSPENALPEYPRPQMVRKDWRNLNGLWQLEFGTVGDSAPVGKDLAKHILVPFPVESALSGVMKQADRLWYRRTFTVPQMWQGLRILLHFGAVDWEAEVFVNGKSLGTHRGGYDGFSFDVTDAKVGDVIDIHVYPGPRAPKPEVTRAGVLGEFGGLGMAVPDHTWTKKTWGYEQFSDAEAMMHRYEKLLRGVHRLAATEGLSAAIYTQITDIETECNGLMTYDRADFKLDPARTAAANQDAADK